MLLVPDVTDHKAAEWTLNPSLALLLGGAGDRSTDDRAREARTDDDMRPGGQVAFAVPPARFFAAVAAKVWRRAVVVAAAVSAIAPGSAQAQVAAAPTVGWTAWTGPISGVKTLSIGSDNRLYLALREHRADQADGRRPRRARDSRGGR